jgi:hypothetical protein
METVTISANDALKISDYFRLVSRLIELQEQRRQTLERAGNVEASRSVIRNRQQERALACQAFNPFAAARNLPNGQQNPEEHGLQPVIPEPHIQLQMLNEAQQAFGDDYNMQ